MDDSTLSRYARRVRRSQTDVEGLLWSRLRCRQSCHCCRVTALCAWPDLRSSFLSPSPLPSPWEGEGVMPEHRGRRVSPLSPRGRGLG